MKITKIAQSNNNFIHLYALEPNRTGGRIVIYERPFGQSSDVFKSILNKSQSNKNQDPYSGRILRFTVDTLTGYTYLPDEEANAYFYTGHYREEDTPRIIKAFKDYVKSKFPEVELKDTSPIGGDPLNTIRVLKVEDFPSAVEFLKKNVTHLKDRIGELNLSVIEANLQLMPETVQQLGVDARIDSLLVDGESSQKEIQFIMKPNAKMGQGNSVSLITQPAPFILINTGTSANITFPDKESIIVRHIHNYVSKKEPDSKLHVVELIKHALYSGMSIKDLCQEMFYTNNVNDLESFWALGNLIIKAADSFSKLGYKSPISKEYHYVVKRSEASPSFLKEIEPSPKGERFSTAGQPVLLKIIYVDEKDNVLLSSPLYIPEDRMAGILGAKSSISAEYDPNDFWIKTEGSSDNLEKESPIMLKVLTEDVWSKTPSPQKPKDMNGRFPIKEKGAGEAMFERKKVSDFYQATETIKKTCAQLSTLENPVQFTDLDVYIGPSQRVFGITAGFLDDKKIKEAGQEIPIDAGNGLKIFPPCMVIDTEMQTSPAARNDMLIHEYQHYINVILEIPSPEYSTENMGNGGKLTPEEVKRWMFYLSSPDEQKAHIAQIKYLLLLGMNKDQILEKMMPAGIRYDNIALAKMYMKFTDTALEEIKNKKKLDEARKREYSLKHKLFEDSEETEEDFFFGSPPDNYDF